MLKTPIRFIALAVFTSLSAHAGVGLAQHAAPSRGGEKPSRERSLSSTHAAPSDLLPGPHAGPRDPAAPTGENERQSSLASPGYGTYAWPVKGPVIRGFEPPQGPYGPGHRGIDIAAAFGSAMVAAQDGVVAFAGFVGGSLVISIDHADGVRTTYSWLSAVQVRKGDTVSRGQLIGQTGHGHPDVPVPHLHFGARIGTVYIDPMLLLEGSGVAELIHLAPLEGGSKAA